MSNKGLMLVGLTIAACGAMAISREYKRTHTPTTVVVVDGALCDDCVASAEAMVASVMVSQDTTATANETPSAVK